MKKQYFLTGFLILMLAAGAFADRKSKKESARDLEVAREAIKKVEALKVNEFPYELGQARYYFQLAEENFSDGERDWASYYADLARITAGTAYYKAQTRTLAWQRIQEELVLWKNLAEENEGEVSKKVKKIEKEILEARMNYAVMSAGFESAENIRSLVLSDRETLIKITFSLKEKAPVSFADFLKVLSWIPETRIMIQGHTSMPDKDFISSKAKADTVKAFLVSLGFSESRIQTEGFGNTRSLEVQGKPVKGPQNDRIEMTVQTGEENLSFVWPDRPFWIKKGKTWQVNPRAALTLLDLREIFSHLPGLEAEIQGHTARPDENGVSLAKAVLMKDYLTQKGGIPSSRIDTAALGNTRPLMNGSKPVAGMANDRLELVLKKGEQRLSFVFSDAVLLQKGGLSIRLSSEGYKKIQESSRIIEAQRIPGSRVVIEAHTAFPDPKNQEGLLKGNVFKELWSESLKVIPGDFTLFPQSNKKPLKINGAQVKGGQNDRIEVFFSVGRKYILQLQDESLFLKKSFLISDQGKATLDRVNELFALIPNASLVIEGHTALKDKDNTLSRSKAEAVRDYFLNVRGIAGTRMQLLFQGDSIPREIGGKPVRGKENDRVSIVIEIPKEN